MSLDDRNEMIHLIIEEKFKAPLMMKFEADMTNNIALTLQSCVVPEVTQFKQVTVDIDGIFLAFGNHK